MKQSHLPLLAMATLSTGLTLSMTARAADQGASTPKRPNIILFLVDDMGWQETSVPFWREPSLLNQRYRTPNMERLAQRGVKFMQAYACAVSSPSRCSLMSGMNAARHRVTNWTLNYDQSTDSPDTVLTLPRWNWNGIQPADKATERNRKQATLITSLPQLLHDAGYYTIHCGKAHFAARGTVGEMPERFGFDVNIAGAANGAPASYLAENEYGAGEFHVQGLEKYYKTGTFLTEALTLEAIEAMKKPISQGQPFYLYMSHYAIHIPYDADKRFTGHYQGVWDPQLKDTLNTMEVNHAALVEGMDKSLGDILNFIDSQPDVARNTIVIFMSDNGGQSVSVRQGRWNHDQNTPARGGKGSAYEGGVHEPMIVSWPGVTQGGTENQNPVIIEDFFPSILEMAQVKDYHTVQHVDGHSFVPLLLHPDKKRDRTLIWHFPNLWGEDQDTKEGFGAYSAIRDNGYHLIYFWATRELRLYNLAEDIGEEHDLAQEQPELTRKLARKLTKELKQMDAQRPAIAKTGKIIPWPDGSL